MTAKNSFDLFTVHMPELLFTYPIHVNILCHLLGFSVKAVQLPNAILNVKELGGEYISCLFISSILFFPLTNYGHHQDIKNLAILMGFSYKK